MLLLHLLKWTYQPERRGRSWQRGILLARQHLDRRLRESPSLRPELPVFMAEAYTDARRPAALETNIPERTFSATCPWSLAQCRPWTFCPRRWGRTRDEDSERPGRYRPRLVQMMNSRAKAAAMRGRTGSLGSASFQSLNSATGSVR